MIRLNKNNPSNDYNKLFESSKPDWQDFRRWKVLMKYFKGGNILDIGCLWSGIPGLIKGKPGLYIGIDEAEKAIEGMKKKYEGNTQLCFEIGDANNLAFEEEIFDAIILGEVLEHVQDPVVVIKEAMRVTKPGGCLAISVPLEEEKEPGAVDKDHFWSLSKLDFAWLKEHGRVKTKVLRSQWFPKYRYCWPTLIVWLFKKYENV